ncbi:MAG: UDP-N-acetylmuramoyl-L-alanyl-D-glutamate--2,6-diaminopimelate ligase, partial [Ruminiclostridium sp.]|nr:UDP-N-acetylmuramoyl-L-alanyl-D-glutamate--2,6-diaminopimelate ligase [Ruminiclostridium sp.]
MKLYDLCPEAQEQGIENIEIHSVTDDTRKLSKGDVFVCIKGGSFDGHEAAPKMIAEGAALVVAERDTGVRPQIIVPDTRKYLA